MTAAALVCAATPQVARAGPEDGCVGDRSKWCDPRVREKLLHRLKLPPAERMAGQGSDFVRLTFVDGRGQLRPAIEFRRRLNDRRVSVHARVDHGVRTRVSQAAADQWSAVEALLSAVRAAPPAQQEREDEVVTPDGTVEVRVCGHNWTVMIETVSDGRVSRRLRNTCDEDPLLDQAFAMAAFARSFFPPCDSLDTDEADRPLRALGDCAYLHGWEFEAAAVVNRVQSAPFDDPDVADPKQVADLFTADAEVRWPGTAAALGREQASALWSDVVKAKDAEAYWGRVEGVRADEVLVTGVVSVRRDGAAAARRNDWAEGAYQQTWIRDADDAWRISRWTIQPFRIVN